VADCIAGVPRQPSGASESVAAAKSGTLGPRELQKSRHTKKPVRLEGHPFNLRF
jgi:hypothetical protein